MKYDLIIHNGTVITMNGSLEILDKGAVCIKNGKISRILKRCGCKHFENSSDQIDAGGGVIMPGLVNANTHLPTVLRKVLPDSISFHDWIHRQDRQAVRVGATLGCAEMLLSGTTTCCDSFFFEDEVTVALLKSGMRGIVSQPIIDCTVPCLGATEAEWKESLEFVRQWIKVSPLVQPHFYCRLGMHSMELFKKVKKAARELDVLLRLETNCFLEKDSEASGSIFRHLIGTDSNEKIALIADANFFSEVDFLNRRGIGWIRTPQGLQDLFPTKDRGFLIGLGTGEWEIEHGLDLFEMMRLAGSIFVSDGGGGNTADYDPISVIGMATIDAARVIGLQETIGSLEEGKSADVIVLDVNNCDHGADAAKRIVSSTTGEHVRHVVVNGKVLVLDRELKTIDLHALGNAVEKIRSQIMVADSAVMH